MIVQNTNGIFFYPTDDSYIVLRYAEKIIKGHPFKLNETDKITPMDPSPIMEFLYASGTLFGIDTPEGLSSYAFWINILLLAFTLIFIFLIATHMGMSLNMALLLSIFSLLSNPFRYNFMLLMGYSMLAFSFYAFFCLWLKGKTLFILPLLLMVISRPDAPLLLIPFIIYSILEKEKKKKIILLITGFFLGFIPHILRFILTGSPNPSGFLHQFILQQRGWASFFYISRYLIDYLKGVFIGFYPSTTESLSFSEYFSSQFPIFFLIFIVLSFLNKDVQKNLKVYLLLLSVFLIQLLISSLTIFLGVHLFRHTAWFLPIFFMMGFWGVNWFDTLFHKNIKKFIFGFYLIIMTILFVDLLIYISAVSISSTLPHYEAAKWTNENIKDKNFAGILDSRFDFFTDDNTYRYYSFGPGENWRIVHSKRKYMSNAYPWEVFYYELIKNPEAKWYMGWSIEDGLVESAEFMKSVIDTIVYEKTYLFNNFYKIGLINKEVFLEARKPFLKKENWIVLDEINPGDPISERNHNFYYKLRFPYGKAISGLVFSNLKKERKIIEGGYLCEYERFNFILRRGNRNDSLFLVVRLSPKIPYRIHYPGFSQTLDFVLKNQKLKIFINDSLIGNINAINLKEISDFKIYIPSEIIRNGKNKCEIVGTHIILHLFIIKKGEGI